MYIPISIFLIVMGLFCRSFSSLLFPTLRISSSICCRAGLVVLNSLSFCLSVKLLISLLNLNEILLGRVILVVGSSLSSLYFLFLFYFILFFCSMWASHCCGLSPCGTQAPDAQAQRLWLTGPAAPRHVESSWTGARTHVPCISRQTLNHCATREAHSFITLNVSCHTLLACRISAEKSAVKLMGVSLYVICRFSLVASNNFSLSLIFVSLITMCLGVFLLGFILPGTLCTSWTWVSISFPMLGKFSTIISSNIFSGPFSLPSPSGTPIVRMLLHLMLSQRFLKLYSFLFILFSLFCSMAVNSTLLSSRSLIRSSASVILLLIPSSVFLISVFVLFISVSLFFNSSRCLFFNSSRSLLNISCVFCIFASILFLRSWITFTIIILNSFSGRLPISPPFSCFSGVLSFSFIWYIALCLFILSIFL
uniref:Uncharacterized protein n=1 Tax=Monodon monoceros TaxID=40151 RepID=A0A8C6F1F1_MONMO